MRCALALVFTCAVATIAAAQTTTPKPQKTKPLTLVGCISPDDANEGQLTFADAKNGTVYRLSGTNAGDYVGRRVQIVGAPNPNKVKVRGGLSPSPNTAAQAGAIDPTRAAMAAQGAGTQGTGAGELPEFTVRTVKPVAGNCPPQKK